MNACQVSTKSDQLQFHMLWMTLMVAVFPSSAKMCEFFLPEPSHQNRARSLSRVREGKVLRAS